MRKIAFVIDEDVGARCHAAQVFASAGWGAMGGGFDGWGVAARAAPPGLILAEVDSRSGGAEARLSAIRAAPTGEAPLVAWTDLPPDDLIALGYDDVLPRSSGPVGVASLARRWRTYDASEALARLGAALGAAEVAAIAAGLRRQLSAILAQPPGPCARDEAHRIAGIAGMLGLAELGARWLAVSHGEAGAWPTARAAARRALVALGSRSAGR